jgi:hypothetical protein
MFAGPNYHVEAQQHLQEVPLLSSQGSLRNVIRPEFSICRDPIIPETVSHVSTFEFAVCLILVARLLLGTPIFTRKLRRRA